MHKKRRKHRKTRLLLLALLILSVIFYSKASAFSKNEKINWYFKSGRNGEQPILLDGSGIAEKYGSLTVGEKGDKTVYLTFDAGYGSENLEKTLDILKENDVKGAFFVLPGIIKNDFPLVMRMINEGHTVGNHSYSHSDMSKLSQEEIVSELTKTEKFFEEKTSYKMSKYFRFPEGSFSENALIACKNNGYTPVFWSFAYKDWDNDRQMSPETAKKKILSSVHDGMLVLLHPNSKTNALILDSVIKEIKSRGYSFGTLDELSEKTQKSIDIP